MIILWGSLFVIFFTAQFIIFNLLIGRSFTEDFLSQWLFIILYPFVIALANVSVNKKGTMTISELKEAQIILSEIGQVMDKWGYKVTSKDHDCLVYDKKNKWGRFWNFIFKEGIEIIPEGDQIKLKGRRNSFLNLESKLKKL